MLATIADGGLGIPNEKWISPYLRRGLKNLTLPHLGEAPLTNFHLVKELDICNRRLQHNNGQLRTTKDINAFWRQRLARMTNDMDLQIVSKVPEAHQWIREPTRLISARDFINTVLS